MVNFYHVLLSGLDTCQGVKLSCSQITVIRFSRYFVVYISSSTRSHLIFGVLWVYLFEMS